jgi:hypothetical protein
MKSMKERIAQMDLERGKKGVTRENQEPLRWMNENNLEYLGQ